VAAPTVESVLRDLPKTRILETGRRLELNLVPSRTKAQLAADVQGTRLGLRGVLPLLRRDELRAACRTFGLDDEARARTDLIETLALAGGEPVAAPDVAPLSTDGLPKPDDIVVVRQRQYLVESVAPSTGVRRPRMSPQATRVSMVCLDDDAQGRRLEVLWELELGARVVEPSRHGLGGTGFDSATAFRAYLHALRWNCVTATDAGLFQAPFRAGIHIMDHQLTPLAKALALPRANLFIADDVGLGKTIEAGLVVQELLLRQRIDTILIVVPPSVALQWRDEMSARFGLQFEIHDRDFVARRRAERGFAVNPWATHSRFIISYQTLRRPEYLDPLLQHLGDRARRSLLILDEAHTVAPASASKYAVDSTLTRVIRDHVAPRFENRLFLSATPHNGHSNSFAALLEILDPQRFTRGIAVTDPAQLEPVMVRRLKSDLGPLGVTSFPTRVVQRWCLNHADGRWRLEVESRRPDGSVQTDPTLDLGEATPHELTLAAKLARYTELMEPERGPGRLVFVNLQKRLLSSIPAFRRTFEAHCKRLATRSGPAQAPRQLYLGDDISGADEEALDEAEAAAVAAASADLRDPSEEAATLRKELQTIANGAQHRPDARIHALVQWIREHQCTGVGIGGALSAPLQDRAWTDTRLIIFTEYADTRRYIEKQLDTHLAGTDLADQRVMRFHGGMSDDQRAEVRRAFNGSPADHPVRILVATDAAREGINLQAWCADLLHFDIPWNPARLEQRNGRIDRTLQPAPEVRCAYFVLPQRPADQVLDTLARKVDVIRQELGSVGAVVLDRVEAVLADGIRGDTATRIEAASADQRSQETARAELESQRTRERLQREIDRARKHLDDSRKVIAFEPEALREVIDIGLGFIGAEPLAEIEVPDPSGKQIRAWRLPDLGADWRRTLDTLRAPKPRKLSYWEWRKTHPPLPVVFTPPPRLTSPVVHLHLEHPFVRRVLARFRAQGFAAHDLERAAVLGNPYDATPRVVAIGRISLFGTGASRLHDELLYVGARWHEAGGEGHCEPDPDDRQTRDRLERLLREPPRPVPGAQRARLQAHIGDNFGRLWPHVEAEADARAYDARLLLERRSGEERDALRRLLSTQRAALEQYVRQTEFDFGGLPKSEARQLQDDLRHMKRRLDQLDREIAEEPEQLAELYSVKRLRVEPVGLVYLWPTGSA
jgi:superfamily II DNA or RNA helicase